MRARGDYLKDEDVSGVFKLTAPRGLLMILGCLRLIPVTYQVARGSVGLRLDTDAWYCSEFCKFDRMAVPTTSESVILSPEEENWIFKKKSPSAN